MIWWRDNERQLLLKKPDVSERLVCGRECEALVNLNEIFIEDNLRFLCSLTLNNFSIKSFNPRHVGIFVNCFYLILNGLHRCSLSAFSSTHQSQCRSVKFRGT